MLGHAELRALLPQRWPMLLLDRVEELEPGVRVTAVKAVTGAEPCYQGLPDGLPAGRYAYPFPLLLESFGQACAVLWRTSTASDPGDVLMFAAARDCVPRAAVYPGDVLRHEARLEHVVPGTAFASGSTWVGDREVATFGSLVAVTRPAAQIERTRKRRGTQMSTTSRFEELRGIVAEVLEVEPEEVTDAGDFVDDYDADSLRAIEILARLEKLYKVEIPQSDLPEMRNLKATYDVVARYAGWQD